MCLLPHREDCKKLYYLCRMKLKSQILFIVAAFCLLGFTSCEETLPENQEGKFASYKQKIDDVLFFMVAVPGGTFQMGATPEQEKEALQDEYPLHDVTLDRFYISETEVTQEFYQKVMGVNPSIHKGGNLPVENVSYEDALAFCAKLTSLSRREYSLPTEAQWEFAARSRNSKLGFIYAGANNLNYQGWYVENSDSTSHIVGYKSPNSLGMLDMSGNVSEWCADWYGSYADLKNDSTVTDASITALVNPTGPATGTHRVVRGGSYLDAATDCRISRRFAYLPTDTLSTVGFRIVAKSSPEEK